METKPIFSIDAMMRCSGNGSGDCQYAEFFCSEAVARVQSAASRLAAMADLATWSDNVRAESESLLRLIIAMHSTVKDFTEFFALKPEMAAHFQLALPVLAERRAVAVAAMEQIGTWLRLN